MSPLCAARLGMRGIATLLRGCEAEGAGPILFAVSLSR